MHDDTRAPGEEALEVQSYSLSATQYTCKPRALKDIVPDEDVSNADVINAEIETTEGLTKKRLLKVETTVAAQVTTSNFTNYTTLSGNAWNGQIDNYDYSDPARIIDYGIDRVRQQSGTKADSIFLGESVWNSMKRHPELVDLFYKGSMGMVTTEQFKSLFPSIKNVYIGGGIVRNSNAGQTAAYEDVWGDIILVYVKGDTGKMKSPGALKIFRWKLYGGKTYKVKKWREEGRGGEMIQVEDAIDAKVTSTDGAYLFSDCLA